MPRFSTRALFTSLTPLLAGFLDLISVFASAYFAHWVRFENFDISAEYQTFVVIGSLMFVLFCAASNAYKPSPGRGAFTLLLQLIINWSVAFALLFTYLVFTKTSASFSRLWLGYWLVGGFLLLIAVRFLFTFFVTIYYSQKGNQKQILLVGDPEIAGKIVNGSSHLISNGYSVVAFISTVATKNSVNYLDASIVVDNPNILEYVNDRELDEIWVCLPLGEESFVDKLVYELRHSTIDIRQVLRTPDLNLLAKNVSEFGSISTLDISCSPHNGGKYLVKVFEDYSIGIVIFVSIIPLLILIALLIKVTSKGPILFKQYRHGVDGKRFKVYKFRSMETHLEDESNVCQATANDPRVTRLGKFLRSTSLDELPQFYNVLQGRMSIVGPRPHALSHNEYYKDLIDSYMRRHMVKPGITGWAQVNGYRGETRSLATMAKRLEFDIFYIENWDIWLDLKIIVLTPIRLIKQRRDTY